MSTLQEASPLRTIRAAVIALALAVTGVLTGCSAADAGYDQVSGGAAFDGAAAPAEEMARADSDLASETGGNVADNRALIITGALYMTVEDPIVAADRAAGIVQRAGGRVDARNETAPEGSRGGSAWLTLRVPSDQLDAVVDDLRALGDVDEFSTNSYDVTAEVTDLEARISTLRASTQRIERLLAEAKDISDIISLENELARRQAELESLEARQRGLDDQVSMSTIDLSLTTEPVVIIEEEGPQNFLDGLLAGWSGLMAFFSVAAIALGILLPWIALLAIIALAIIVPIRLAMARNARRRAEAGPSQMAAPPAPAPTKSK